MSTTNYGVEFNGLSGAPEVTRIGNMMLHEASALPVHNKIRKAVLNDDGTVNYWLHKDNDALKEDGVTPSVLDGTDGQVMSYIPAHWVRWDTHGDIFRIQISDKELQGYYYQRSLWVGYEATVHRPTNKLSSVVSLDPDYRGGNNNSSWDSQPNTLLGRAASSISLTNFRAYAKNRGAKWNAYLWEVHNVLYYLFLIEYATRNSQAAYNAALTPEGYRQGGLGPGVTTVVSADWITFNNRYAFVPIGITGSLGSNTGVISYTELGWPTGPVTVEVPSYRGIEHPFGHLWKWTDGVLFNVLSDEEGGESILYACVSDDYASALTDDYKEIGLIPRANGYISEMLWDRRGGLLPRANVGASATTYWCDNFYASVPASGASLRGLLVGGLANSGAAAGFGCSYSLNAPSRTSALIGSRLCLLGE